MPVTARVPDVVIGDPDTVSQLGVVRATLVTDPEPLLLNVVQSADAKHPACDPEATLQVMLGVDPPELTIGAEAVTEVTPVEGIE